MHEDLPAWLVYGPLAVATAEGLVIAAALWVLAGRLIRPLRDLPAETPWVTRARLVNRAVTTFDTVAGVAGGCVVALLIQSSGKVSFLPAEAEPLAGLWTATLGWLFAQARLRTASTARDVSFGRSLRDAVGLGIIRYGDMMCLLTMVFMASNRFDLRTFVVLLVALALRTAELDGALVWAMGALRLLVPDDARVRNLGMSRVHVLDCTVAGGFVFPRSGRVILTTGVFDALEARELKAYLEYCARHVGSVRRWAGSRVWVRAGITLAAVLARPTASVSVLGAYALMGVCLALWSRLGALDAQALRDADARAGQDDGAWASALVALHRWNAVAPEVGVPSLTDRLVALGQPPVWPPHPPPPERPSARALAAGGLALIGLSSLWVVLGVFGPAATDPRIPLALGLGGTPEVRELAEQLRARRQFDQAGIVYEAGARALPTASLERARLEVLALVAQGHCGAAERRWEEAGAPRHDEWDDQVAARLAGCEAEAGI